MTECTPSELRATIHPKMPEGKTETTMNRRIHWRLIFGLAGLHLLLLAVVYFGPVLVGGPTATFSRWARTLHAALNGAQYQLLAVFWAISGCQWRKRTALACAGAILLSFAHVAIMLAVTKSEPSFLSASWDILMNTIQVFIGHWLVLAILLELFRPLWGSLTLGIPQEPEQTSIYTIMRTTTLSAVAAMVLQHFGEFVHGIDSVLWFCKNALFETAFVATCVWMVFATRRNSIGLIVLPIMIVVGVASAHPNLLRNGPLQPAIHLILNAAWLCTTFLIVRCFGFRLRKQVLEPTSAVLQQRRMLPPIGTQRVYSSSDLPEATFNAGFSERGQGPNAEWNAQ